MSKTPLSIGENEFYHDARGCFVVESKFAHEIRRSLERRNSELTDRIAELEKGLASARRDANEWFDKYEVKLTEKVNLKGENDWLKKQLAEARKDSAWRPIDTAPKDGTRILYYDIEGIVYAGCWDAKFAYVETKRGKPKHRGAWTDHGVASFGYEEYTEQSPIGWMPLPATPLPETKDGQL